MGIVDKDPDDPGPTNLKEKFLRLLCRIFGHNIKNFQCKKCGAKFIPPDFSWLSKQPPMPPLPPKPENYVK